jgi:hypothetical protein
LHESERDYLRAFAEIDSPPILIAKLAVAQTLPVNTLTAIAFDTIIDTAGWWSGSIYTPTAPGFYRCAWAVAIADTSAIAVSTFGAAQLNTAAYSFSYGNGSGLDMSIAGSAIIECDGATGITLSAYLFTGTSVTIEGTTPARTWLSIDYLGRRPR